MAVALFLPEADSSQSLARRRVFRDRLNPLNAYNNAEFISRYRITKNIFVQLEEKVSTFLRRSAIQSSVIPPTTQLAAALMFLATSSLLLKFPWACVIASAISFLTLFFSS